MSMTDDGGPAFPRSASEDRFNEENYPPQRGMSLRDWFAGMAMQGWLASWPHDGMLRRTANVIESADSLAALSYQLADAMIIRAQEGRS